MHRKLRIASAKCSDIHFLHDFDLPIKRLNTFEAITENYYDGKFFYINLP